MFKHYLLILPFLLLVGCDDTTLDATVISSDSRLIKQNEYSAEPFTLEKIQTVKVALINHSEVAAEAFLVTETEYKTWQAVTQNQAFELATLFPQFEFPAVTGRYESPWIALPKGNYYLLIENTNFGSVKISNANITGSSNIQFTIKKKNM